MTRRTRTGQLPRRGWAAPVAIIAAAACLTAASAATAAQSGIRINEVSLKPPGGQFQWIELYNAGSLEESASGWVLTDLDGDNYTLPVALPPVPAGAFVLVYFDGLGPGSDDYDFGDNVTILHSPPGMVDPFESDGGQVALYSVPIFSPQTITSFVAWGPSPGSQANDAVESGLWLAWDTTISIAGTSDSPKGPAPIIEPGGTLGVVGLPSDVTHDSWSGFAYSQATPGAINPLPAPVIYLPADKDRFDDWQFNFSWVAVPLADHYEIQICADSGCGSPLFGDATLVEPHYTTPPLPLDAVYHWRVRAYDVDSVAGPWAGPYEFTVGYPPLPPPPPTAPAPAGAPRNDYTVSGQVTDSVSGRGLGGVTIDLGGGLTTTTGPNGSWSISGVPAGPHTVSASRTGYGATGSSINVTGDLGGIDFAMTGDSNTLGVVSLAARKDTKLLCLDRCEEFPANNRHWDGSHEALVHWWTHERMYCPYTAIRMINNYYGGTITRDEVAWKIKAVDSDPTGDLDHNVGTTDDETTTGLAWALQTAAGNLNYSRTRPTDEQLIAWIDGGRPVMYSTPSHWMVVDGYRHVDGNLEGRFLNTDNDGSVAWRRFSTHSFDSYFAPNAGLTGRATDPRVTMDTDGDGVMDFDEDLRFQCSKNMKDTDRDQVEDKNDIRNYTFHQDYHAGHKLGPAALADIDKDGLRGENDCDSDSKDGVGGDGDFDGGEDINGDGHNPDAGETCMYDPHDWLITVHVDKDEYLIGEKVFIVDIHGSRETHTYHANSSYYYELGKGCPDKVNDTPLGHHGSFSTEAGGHALQAQVMTCQSPGQYYLTVDVLGDFNYSEPDNTDPQTCWVCKRRTWDRVYTTVPGTTFSESTWTLDGLPVGTTFPGGVTPTPGVPQYDYTDLAEDPNDWHWYVDYTYSGNPVRFNAWVLNFTPGDRIRVDVVNSPLFMGTDLTITVDVGNDLYQLMDGGGLHIWQGSWSQYPNDIEPSLLLTLVGIDRQNYLGCATCPGDMNGSGHVDLDDIPSFVDALLYDQLNPCSDINEDNATNSVDVQGMIELILADGGAGTSCHTTICVPPGDDCWSTLCDGHSFFSFDETPLPPDFFNPGSDPFWGPIMLGGAGAPLLADTVVSRTNEMCFPEPLPSAATVPIELVSLSLVSCQPITVSYNGGQNPQQWDVSVDLSVIPSPQGTMTAVKTYPSGGTFDSILVVRPRFIFVRVGNPSDVRQLDTGLAGMPPVQLSAQNGSWLHSEPFGSACAAGFAPGFTELPPGDPCCIETCHSSFGTAPHQHCVYPPSCEPCPH